MRKTQIFVIVSVLLSLCIVSSPFLSQAAENDTWKESIEAPAPDFVLKDLEGKDVRLSDCKGKMVLLYFMTTWCIKCRSTIPYLKEIHAKYKDKNVVVLAIDVSESLEKVCAYTAKYKLPYRVLLDDGKVAFSYNVIGVPTFVLINAEGTIICKQCRSIDMFLDQLS